MFYTSFNSCSGVCSYLVEERQEVLDSAVLFHGFPEGLDLTLLNVFDDDYSPAIAVHRLHQGPKRGGEFAAISQL